MTIRKIDNRRKYFMVFDTETTALNEKNTFGFPLIYDIGYAIVDKLGRVYAKDNFIIKEIYYSKLMINAFFGSKRPLYDKMIENKEIKVGSFAQAMYKINKDIEKFPNMTLSAYNLGFDLRALRSTSKFTKLKWYDVNDELSMFWSKVHLQDIWALAVETILVPQKNFKKFVKKHDLYTEKGNIITNAEVVYRYLINDNEFIEDHMALSDVMIEVEILAHSLKQNKKFTKGIRYSPFWLLKKWKKEVA